MSTDQRAMRPGLGSTPPMEDRDSAPWWESMRRHEFVMQRCSQCSTWRWPPRAICGKCGSFEWEWQPFTQTGRVLSHITTQHPFGRFEVPFHSVLVQLTFGADGERTDINMPGGWAHPDRPVTGQEVVASFADFVIEEEPVTLLVWEPK